MKKSFIILFAAMIALDLMILQGQIPGSTMDYKLHYDSLYGMDPQLFNGIKYFPEHPLARGFPFYMKDESLAAGLVYSGRYYENLDMKYNLYTQEFILEYTDQYGGLQQLILNRAEIDSVFMEESVFIKNKYNDINQYFLQVIYEDTISCYFARKKEYRFYNTGINLGYEYSNELVTSFIVINGSVHVFRNNPSFLKIFEEGKRDSIKKYMKENRIKVRKKRQAEMINLCRFCNKLNLE
jgi:hypothetical protein